MSRPGWSDHLRNTPAGRTIAATVEAMALPASHRWITRFAPSPTGELHLGHVAHAMWVWGVAELLDATVLIRMEDHDRTRCRPEHEASILDDLAWLGFHPDVVSRISLDHPPSPYRQSDHPERYQHAVDMLAASTRVYSCHCTRSMMEAPDARGERRHPDGCRRASIMPDATDAGSTLRVELPDGEVGWTDLLSGPAREHPWRRVGDTALRDAQGQWTYQCCVVVDDLHDGVNLIVRGEDLRASTGRQLLLGELLGRTAPVTMLHHPLVLGEDGRKLSKRDRSETVRAMRERGMGVEEILARVGYG